MIDTFTDWKLWLLILIAALLLIWLFYGGEEQEFIGLTPILNNDGDSSDEEDEFSDEEVNYYSNTNSEENMPRQRRSRYKEKVIIDPDDAEYATRTTPKMNVSIPNFQTKKSPKTVGRPRQEVSYHNESRGEALVRKILMEMYDVPFIRARPAFLRNPGSGENLELDCYNEELKIAAEYNGIQHYNWPNYTGQTEQEFKDQLQRDLFKVDQCDLNGIYLITVPYDIPYEKIGDYIEYYRPENAHKRESNQVAVINK